MSDHATRSFDETDCAVGGAGCANWNAWYQGRREYARAHGRARALDAIADDTAYSEALDDLAEELGPAYLHPPVACANAGCACHVPAAP
jgi:hypothetical protein